MAWGQGRAAVGGGDGRRRVGRGGAGGPGGGLYLAASDVGGMQDGHQLQRPPRRHGLAQSAASAPASSLPAPSPNSTLLSPHLSCYPILLSPHLSCYRERGNMGRERGRERGKKGKRESEGRRAERERGSEGRGVKKESGGQGVREIEGRGARDREPEKKSLKATARVRSERERARDGLEHRKWGLHQAALLRGDAKRR